MAKKKKEAEEKKKPQEIVDLLKRSGATVMLGDRLETLQALRRPTGVASIDAEIGGGFGAGVISLVHGPESSCKTWLAVQTLVQQQELCGHGFRGLYATCGTPLDKSFARLHGLTLPFSSTEDEATYKALYTRLQRLEPSVEHLEQVSRKRGDLWLAFADLDQEKSLERLLQTCVEAVKSMEFQIVVIDDLGGLLTEGRNKDLYGKEPDRADYARLTTQFVQHVESHLQMHSGKFNATTVLIAAQARVLMSGGLTFVGGSCLRHQLGTRLKMSHGDDRELRARGCSLKPIDWFVAKGKFGHGEGGKGVFLFSPANGIDRFADLAQTAATHEVVHQGGGGIYTFGDLKVKGKDALASALETNPELAKAVLEGLRQRLYPNVRHS